MEYYLMKIYKMNRRAVDASSIENFYYSAIEHLNNVSHGHERYLSPMRKALYRFQSPQMISLVYRIAGELNITLSTLPAGDIIPNDLLKTHFKRKSIRGFMLGYLAKNSITFLDKKIVEKLQMNPTFVEPNLCHYVEKYYEHTAKFMKMTDPGCFYKQLFIIERCHVEFDTDYFLEALGSTSKLRASHVYEAFTVILLRRSKSRNKQHHTLDSGAIWFDSELLLSATRKLVIESPINFISFGFNFIKDRDLVNSSFLATDMAGLNRLLLNYTDSQLLNENFKEVELCWCKPVSLGEGEVVSSLEKNFDYLFNRSYKRPVCDCFEA